MHVQSETMMSVGLAFCRFFCGVGLSGLLLFAAFPPIDKGEVAWVALVPAFLAFSPLRGFKPATGMFLTGCFFLLSPGSGH